MFKKLLTSMLGILVFNLAFGATAFGETKEERAAKQAEKVKANITKLGSGEAARVEVKLKDGTKLKGYVSEIKEDSFVVMNDKTASPVEVPYPQTKQVKGNNWNTGVKIAVVVVLVIAGVALICILAPGCPD